MSYAYVPWRLPLDVRDPDEEHRASTPLELLFDLSFVVAVAAAAAALHHDLASGHWTGLVAYAMTFFGIWWAWLNYSWFASAYDTGDVVMRLVTFVILTGVLVLAAGVPRVFDDDPDFKIVVVGYLIMRVALVPMWLRVAHDDPPVRPIAVRYAAGVTIVQVLWVTRLGFPDGALGLISFVCLALAELAVPYWAENSIEQYTPWHVEHIVERFSLFTIIVLGEVILATSQAISATLDGHGLTWDLTGVIAGGLLLVLSVWWIYFKRPLVECINGRDGFVFGYAHYFLLGSVASIGAALATCVDVVEDHAHGLEPRAAALCLAVPVCVYLLALGSIHAYGDRSWRTFTGSGIISALTLAAALAGTALSDHVGLSVLLIGLVTTFAVVEYQVRR